MDRTGLEYWNSEKGEADWKELLHERFNDDKLVYLTKTLPHLHDRFRGQLYAKGTVTH